MGGEDTAVLLGFALGGLTIGILALVVQAIMRGWQ